MTPLLMRAGAISTGRLRKVAPDLTPYHQTSPLDDIHIDRWPHEWVTELNELLTALRRVTDLEPEQAVLLDRILDGPTITVAELTASGVQFPKTTKDRKPRYGLANLSGDQDTLI